MRKKVASTEPAGMSDQLRHKYVHFIIIQVHEQSNIVYFTWILVERGGF